MRSLHDNSSPSVHAKMVTMISSMAQWLRFKAKYHPEECVKRKEEQLANLKRRVSVFNELFDAKRLEAITVDADQSDQLLKLLDSVVIKLEGGSDFDLQVLDQQPEEEIKPQPLPEEKKPFILGEDSSDEENEKEKTEEKSADEPLTMDMTEEQIELQKKAKEFLKQKGTDDEETGKKRKHSGSS